MSIPNFNQSLSFDCCHHPMPAPLLCRFSFILWPMINSVLVHFRKASFQESIFHAWSFYIFNPFLWPSFFLILRGPQRGPQFRGFFSIPHKFQNNSLYSILGIFVPLALSTMEGRENDGNTLLRIWVSIWCMGGSNLPPLLALLICGKAMLYDQVIFIKGPTLQCLPRSQ